MKEKVLPVFLFLPTLIYDEMETISCPERCCQTYCRSIDTNRHFV